jgi:hypothetical protein
MLFPENTLHHSFCRRFENYFFIHFHESIFLPDVKDHFNFVDLHHGRTHYHTLIFHVAINRRNVRERPRNKSKFQRFENLVLIFFQLFHFIDHRVNRYEFLNVGKMFENKTGRLVDLMDKLHAARYKGKLPGEVIAKPKIFKFQIPKVKVQFGIWNFFICFLVGLCASNTAPQFFPALSVSG